MTRLFNFETRFWPHRAPSLLLCYFWSNSWWQYYIGLIQWAFLTLNFNPPQYDFMWFEKDKENTDGNARYLQTQMYNVDILGEQFTEEIRIVACT